MTRALLLLVALSLLGTACTTPRGGSCEQPFSFPAAFDALQVVRVTSDGQMREFLGSVSRRGEDYQIAFLDPAIQRPFLEIEVKAGKVSEKGELPEDARQQLPQLVDAIRELYAATCFNGTAERMELTGSRFKSQLERFNGDAGCRFPGLVTMVPRLGSAVKVEVETNDFGCTAP